MEQKIVITCCILRSMRFRKLLNSLSTFKVTQGHMAPFEFDWRFRPVLSHSLSCRPIPFRDRGLYHIYMVSDSVWLHIVSQKKQATAAVAPAGFSLFWGFTNHNFVYNTLFTRHFERQLQWFCIYVGQDSFWPGWAQVAHQVSHRPNPEQVELSQPSHPSL